MSKAAGVTLAYRVSVASRVVAATLGGYALTSAVTVLLALLWPAAPRAQGVLWATMLSFAVYTAAVVWVFCARSATRAWGGMLIATAVSAGLAWLLAVGASA